MLNKFGKLLKYEFLFYFRILPPLYLVVILAALIMRFQGTLSGMAFPLVFLVWGGTLIAMTILTVILIIQRYTDNFMKDSGALMFTLPVTVWALLASKAVAAFCMIITGTLAVFVSSNFYLLGTENQLPDFLSGLNLSGTELAGIIITVFIFIFTTFQQICLIYLAITASRLLPRFRFAAACGIYIVAMNFTQTVSNIIDKKTGIDIITLSNPVISQNIFRGIAALAFAILFFGVTGYLLKHRFNHE